MSDAVYIDPDDPEPSYINMQRGRIVSNSTYTDHSYNGRSSYAYGEYGCCYQRGTVIITLLAVILCCEICGLSMGVYLLYQSGYIYHWKPAGGGSVSHGVDSNLKQLLDNIKSQLEYAMTSITYGIPKEFSNILRQEVDRISKDVDKLEILVLSSVVDLNVSLNPNNTFSLSTGTKVSICQQYLNLLKRGRSDRCRQDRTRNFGPTTPDRTKNTLPYAS
ncbi:putative TM protein [Mount Mabu Lophuromys virus 1]|uniref:Putative TM protein n=1 Tax=Mount Mabu Lophuromys virus 1 TaxID=2116559 RepID=A0A2P1GJ84_9MONO|nr:putative TM protein [Mount Mabu Lophuromys virus 1]AVM86017.1 putative TM protein [Mount Mabu Lophuromys virus 1]